MTLSVEVAGAALIVLAFTLGLALGTVIGYHDGKLVGASEERRKK